MYGCVILSQQKQVWISLYPHWVDMPESTTKEIEMKLLLLIMPPQHIGQYGWEYNIACQCHEAQESRLKTKLSKIQENGVVAP